MPPAALLGVMCYPIRRRRGGCTCWSRYEGPPGGFDLRCGTYGMMSRPACNYRTLKQIGVIELINSSLRRGEKLTRCNPDDPHNRHPGPIVGASARRDREIRPCAAPPFPSGPAFVILRVTTSSFRCIWLSSIFLRSVWERTNRTSEADFSPLRSRGLVPLSFACTAA